MTAFRVEVNRRASFLPFGLFCFLTLASIPAAAADRAASFLPIEEPAADTTAPTQTLEGTAAGAPIPLMEGATPLGTQTVDPGIVLGEPVESATLSEVNPDSVGLLAPDQGGLGASLWKNTPRLLVERLLPALSLPTASPTLNNLAQRFLLTTAAVPEGVVGGTQSLTALRVEKLVALGDASNAWKLALAAKPELIDEITWHLVAETALATISGDDVCARLPTIMQSHPSPEWEKLQVVCQLRAKDVKAAQVNLDLLHSQNVQDPPFFELAERTIIAGGKQLPRQLTPLKPLTLALLRLTDLPLRGELYARPDAALAPELLKTKAAEEDARLMLAERSAQRGLIDGATLGDVYRSQTLAGNEVLNPTASHLTGAQRHALFYQAALQEKKVRERVDLTLRMLQDSTPEDLNGVLPRTAANLIGDVQPTAELNAFSAGMARLYILAGKSDLAQAWLKQALAASATTPKVTDELQPMWPLIVIAGLESNDNYPKEREAWLADALKSSPDARAAREGAASVLLLLDALGFAVTEEDWAKVADAGETEKRNLPPALILERLRAAGTANRRGETVLMALLAEGDKEPAFAVTLAAIRALRQAGLTADAAGLAREEIVRLTAGLSAKP